MRKLLLVLLFFFMLASLPAKEKLKLDQVLSNKGEPLFQPLPMVQDWVDEQHYLELKKMQLMRVDARSGKEELFLDSSHFKTPVAQGFNLMQIIRGEHTTDWHRFVFNKDNDLYLYLREKDEIKRITQGKEEENNPLFSPDGQFVAFTRAGDLYVYDIAKAETLKLTNDGSEDILNGYASWVYYEEILGRGLNYRAYWWSPDSKKIAFLRSDQSKVPIFPIYRADGDYGMLEKQRYPKPGYPNPEVKLGIAEISTKQVSWVPIQEKGEYYAAFPVFNSTADLCYFQWLNRGQDDLRIMAYDLKKKTLQIRYEEKQPCWVDFLEGDDFNLLANGDLLIRSSKSGWFHIYLVKGGQAHPLTQGEWSVKGIQYVDEKKGIVFFTASKDDSTETGFYRISFNGKNLVSLGNFRGTHMVTASPQASYFIDRYSDVTTPTKMNLIDRNGKLIRKLGDSYSPNMDKYDLGKVELFRFTTEDGFKLPAVWTLPPNLDKAKKYPVLINVYGGPNMATVSNGFGRGLTNWYLAQEGIISIAVDHRGSGHFGKKGVDLMYRNLGKWEMNDYIAAVKYLRTLPFVDPNKIAITGGSYGGYSTAMALTFGAEFFKFGLAHFSVIDWRLYDSVYTERYMDTPQENPEGYKNGSVLTYVDRYKGGLRITHGTMDDNVHMQNTIQLIDKVLDADKPVELMLYPGERHGFRGKKNAEFQRSNLEFIFRNLLGRPLQ